MHLVFAAGFLFPQQLAGLQYFRGLPEHFPDALFPGVPPAGTVELRAHALSTEIARAFPNGPIHLIAHSMGGLDARYLLAHDLEGLARPGRIVCLSTVATPHRGSPIADLLTGDGVSPFYNLVNGALRQMGLPVGALHDLTSEFSTRFNQQCPPVPTVCYRSYGGRSVHSLLLEPMHTYIKYVGRRSDEKANDGLVALASASFGEWAEDAWDADHFSEVGHDILKPGDRPPFDHIAAFERVVRKCAPV